MGPEPMIFFLVLAIVSITGKVASSSSRKGGHHSRRYPSNMGSESESETFMLKYLDEKQSSPRSIPCTNSELPMFRVRQTGISETKEKATTTLKLEKDTNLLEKRRLLKETLRIVIPDSEMISKDIRPTRGGIPSSFDLYADADGWYRDITTQAIPFYLARSRKAPRLRYSYVDGNPTLAESGSKQVAREREVTTEGRGRGQLCMDANIERVVFLKTMQREDKMDF